MIAPTLFYTTYQASTYKDLHLTCKALLTVFQYKLHKKRSCAKNRIIEFIRKTRQSIIPSPNQLLFNS